MTTAGRLVSGAAAILIAAAIAVAVFLCFGVGLPKWIYGSDTTESPYGGLVLTPFASFAAAYSLLAFILLAVFFYRRFVPKSRP